MRGVFIVLRGGYTHGSSADVWSAQEDPMPKLSEADIQSELGKLPDWAEVGGQIQRTFEFADFPAAVAFVNRIAEVAEERQHHPDIMIRYNKVTLALTTHDSGGITEKDFAMAESADTVATA